MREQSLGEIRFATLARAAEGLTQWRPLLMSFLTLLVTALLIGLSTWMLVKAGFFMSTLFMLAAMIALLAGSSAVGIMLMDKAKNEPIRSFAAAASAGLLCLPKFILVGLVVFVATLAYGLMAAIVYFVCKIPLIGAILAFVAHPILVLVAAALLIALIWVIGPLMGPALWSGLSVKAALANVLSIARKRLIEVVLMEVVLYIILTLICVMLFAGLVPATMSLTSMAVGITGGADGMMNMFGGRSSYGGGYGGGYGGMGFNPMRMLSGNGASAGLLAGLGVMYCVIGALLAQVAIMGMNLIYLQARESVDPSEAEWALDSLIGDVRKKAEEAKAQTMAAAERTMAAAERAKQAATERLQEAAAKPADTPPPATSQDTGTTATGATAGLAAATAASTEQAFAEQQARERAAAEAAEKARLAAEEEAARLRTQAEVARVRAEAEAARLKAEAQAAEQAARERATQQKAAEEARLKAAAARQEAELQAQREAAKAKADAEAAEKARQAQAAANCPACQTPVAADDLFCGECGHRLK